MNKSILSSETEIVVKIGVKIGATDLKIIIANNSFSWLQIVDMTTHTSVE